MKIVASLMFVLLASPAFCQYYYQDIVGTHEASELAATYRNNKVTSVMVKSYDAGNVLIPDLNIVQQFSPASGVLTTITKSPESGASVLRSYFDGEGRLIRATDSSATAILNSVYSYRPDGQLASIKITSTDSTRDYIETEDHIWQYNGDDVSGMLKIKNRVDTAIVHFKLDENNNVVEEQETRKGLKQEPVYYYYDDNNRLTDIVRFNGKAKRLLPEYLFEYSAANRVIQKITVPANTGEYIIWRYQFDERGLKTKEAIYNKQKQLTGRIEYQYGFGS